MVKVIAHLLFSFGRGGMENGVLKLVNGSDREKFRHVIVSFTPDLSLQTLLQGDNSSLYVINKSSIIGNVNALIKIIKREKVSILHARGWPTMLEGALLGFLLDGVSTVYSFHGRSFEELSRITWKRKYTQILLARCFDQVVTLTPSMRKEIAQEFKLAHKKIKVVPNGVPQRKDGCRKKALVRGELGIGADDPVVGYVGRLDPVKNIGIVIEAFEQLSKQCHGCWLVIVGEGAEENKLKSLASNKANSHRILFTGYRENVFDLMQIFDVYVQASIYEGLSNTILEAMSLGLPIVCSEVGGNNDIICHGENGYLFPCQDVKMLAGYLGHLLTRPQERSIMVSKNITKASSLYSVAAMVRGYEHIYESL